MAVISSESELYSLSHFFSKIINLGLLSRLRDLKGRWVLAVDATSQISSVDLSVIFAGILHKDHGFLPLVASMQVYNPYSHYFGAYSHFIFQNPLDTTTFSKIFTILKEVAPCDPTVVMADGDGVIRAAVFPDALMAMCWFHCKRACKRNLGKYPSWSCSHFFCLSQAS